MVLLSLPGQPWLIGEVINESKPSRNDGNRPGVAVSHLFLRALGTGGAPGHRPGIQSIPDER
jgi:hypothetical protein